MSARLFLALPGSAWGVPVHGRSVVLHAVLVWANPQMPPRERPPCHVGRTPMPPASSETRALLVSAGLNAAEGY